MSKFKGGGEYKIIKSINCNCNCKLLQLAGVYVVKCIPQKAVDPRSIRGCGDMHCAGMFYTLKIVYVR
jgi:hypothetical protein